ncbi:MAG: glycosyltransferase family 4 protein [Acidobacteria bacterium]|nr:glycosyltransferase family 4 protein [Acidobacteriota bacterium]
MEKHEPEIGYVLKGYPRTSETFISNEIFLLEQAGLRISIFSLKKIEGQQLHSVINKINARVNYLPQTSPLENGKLISWIRKNFPLFIASHLKLFTIRPVAYLGALIETIAMSLRYRIGPNARPVKDWVKEFWQAGYIALGVLESGRIRHLHAHFCHTSATVTMLASRMCKVPFSFTAHAKDIYRKDLNPGDLLPVKMRRARFIVTCTKANREYLGRLGTNGTPIFTIYHGIDLKMFDRSEKRWRDDERRFPLILSVGRMVEKKGFVYLVEACRLLKDRGHDFECSIVGGTDHYAEEIKNVIERLKLGGTVRLHSAITQEELRKVYQQATIFALPCQVVDDGDRDGIPNVLVEAMAMELPVVSTVISGIPELIEDRVNGLLVPEKNVSSLAAALEELLNDSKLRLRLGSAARQSVSRAFDSGQNIQELKGVFERMMEEKDEG